MRRRDPGQIFYGKIAVCASEAYDGGMAARPSAVARLLNALACTVTILAGIACGSLLTATDALEASLHPRSYTAARRAGRRR
jgi:hypothetical protein